MGAQVPLSVLPGRAEGLPGAHSGLLESPETAVVLGSSSWAQTLAARPAQASPGPSQATTPLLPEPLLLSPSGPKVGMHVVIFPFHR